MLDLTSVRTYPIAERKNLVALDDFVRPGKNVVRRPVSLGGEGFNFRADHRQSIPSLHRKLLEFSGGGTPPATHSAQPRRVLG